MGEQAMSKIAEIGLKTQLDDFDELTVDIQASPESLVDGTVESATIQGHGIERPGDDLRTEKLHVETGAIAINPWKAVLGIIELKQTVEGKAQITLTEADINRAFTPDFLMRKVETLQIRMDGQTTRIELKQAEFCLPGEGKVHLQAEVQMVASGQTSQIGFTAIPTISADGHQIRLEPISYDNGTNPLPDVTAALIESASELLDMRNFELEGMHLQLRRLTVLSGQLEIEADANIEKLQMD